MNSVCSSSWQPQTPVSATDRRQDSKTSVSIFSLTFCVLFYTVPCKISILNCYIIFFSYYNHRLSILKDLRSSTERESREMGFPLCSIRISFLEFVTIAVGLSDSPTWARYLSHFFRVNKSSLFALSLRLGDQPCLSRLAPAVAYSHFWRRARMEPGIFYNLTPLLSWSN